jgi:hypothetical protein
MEMLDAEVLLDGRQAVLHYLRWADCDPRPLLDALADKYRLLITLHDLQIPAEVETDEEWDGCGEGKCGSGSSGCGSCTGGSCSHCTVAGSAVPNSEPARLSLL